jgi:hypothetical protein
VLDGVGDVLGAAVDRAVLACVGVREEDGHVDGGEVMTY